MVVLAALFAIVTVVLAVGGVLKALRPAGTAHALRAMGLPGSPLLVRVLGTGEAVLAVGALVTGHAALAITVAVSYLAFAGFVALALRLGRPISSCGCLGAVDTPPSLVHVGIDVAAAGVAAAATAAAASEVALPDVLAGAPLLGIPFLLLVALGAGLVLFALTALPSIRAAARGVGPRGSGLSESGLGESGR